MEVSHNTEGESKLRKLVLEKVQKSQREVWCRKAYTERFLDELTALREKRSLQEKENKPLVKPLILNPPPRGRLDTETRTR